MILAWQTPWWWRDVIVLAQLQVVFSIAGAVLALGAVLYARHVATRQFSLLSEQDGLMKDQLTLIKAQTEADARVADLTAELKTIVGKQGEIAETQLAVVRTQLYLTKRPYSRLPIGGLAEPNSLQQIEARVQSRASNGQCLCLALIRMMKLASVHRLDA